MHELRNVGELKALLLDGIPLQEWGIYGDRFDNLIVRVRKEAKTEALRDAADEFIPRVPLPRSHRDNQRDVQGWLNRRADLLEGGDERN